ncbi:hypothetical protein J5751_04725 [bacterium]|nr:hypothetical protein [bacterium]
MVVHSNKSCHSFSAVIVFANSISAVSSLLTARNLTIIDLVLFNTITSSFCKKLYKKNQTTISAKNTINQNNLLMNFIFIEIIK